MDKFFELAHLPKLTKYKLLCLPKTITATNLFAAIMVNY